MKEKEKIEPKFEKFYPQTECVMCNGRGEIKSDYINSLFGGHWNYRKCTDCKGSGKNEFSCMTCNEKIYHHNGMACVNMNCKMYNIKVLLAMQKDN